MGKQGWLTIRNIPKSKKFAERNPYYYILKKFFEKNKLCPKCGGIGSSKKIKKGRVRSEATIRYEGIPELEKLNNMEDVKLTDSMRDILEKIIWGKKFCKLCKGFGFIPKK